MLATNAQCVYMAGAKQEGIWWITSRDNLQLIRSDPTKFLVQYENSDEMWVTASNQQVGNSQVSES